MLSIDFSGKLNPSGYGRIIAREISVLSSSLTKRSAGISDSTVVVSLVVVVHDNDKAAERCIASFREVSSIKSEVIVVNNGERNLDYCGADKIIHIDNRGFSHGVNRGAEQARGPLLLICNPDIVFLERSVKALVEYLESVPFCGVVGPRVYGENRDVQPTARPFPVPWALLFNRTSLFSRLFPNNRLTASYLRRYSEATEPVEPDWVSGCCMLIRRQAFEEIKGFDEGYFLFMEDVDFCWRLWKSGNWHVSYLPDAGVIHSVGVSNRNHDKTIIRHRHKSIRRFINKYYCDKSIFVRGLGKLLISMRELFMLMKATVASGRKS